MKRGTFIVGIIFVILAIFPFTSCNSPEEPEVYNYRNNVEVIYTRDTSKITNPAGKNSTVFLDFELYDPEKSPARYQGFHSTEQINANVFRVYLPRVFIQTEKTSVKHKVWVADPMLKLFDNTGREIPTSSFTGENIVINGAYDLQIVPLTSGTELHFKME